MALEYVQQDSKLVGSGTDPDVGPGQGYAVAISADGATAVSGAAFDDPAGCILIFKRAGSSWSEFQRIDGGDPIFTLGYSVAISDDGLTILVGAPQSYAFPDPAHEEHPAFLVYPGTALVYVYDADGGLYVLEQEIQGTLSPGEYPNLHSRYGESVALSADGNTAVIGGPWDGSYQGAAWVWTRSGGGWTEQAKLIGSSSTQGGTFGGGTHSGHNVAISGDGLTLLSAGTGSMGDPQASFLYTFELGSWSEQTIFDQGYGVALDDDGDTALVGDALAGGVGSVTVYKLVLGSWLAQDVLNPDDADPELFFGSFFGFSVAINDDGDVAVVGAPSDGPSAFGGFWVFADDGGWVQQGEKFLPFDADVESNDGNEAVVQVGYSVAITGDESYLVIGGPWDDNLAPYPSQAGVGATWVYRVLRAGEVAGQRALAVARGKIGHVHGSITELAVSLSGVKGHRV